MSRPNAGDQARIDRALQRAWQFAQAGNLPQAYAALTPLAGTDAVTPEFLILRASLALGLRLWSEASPLVARLRVLVPHEQAVRLHHAALLIGLDQVDAAKAALNAADLPDPRCSNQYLLLARVAARRGDDAAAVAWLRRAVGPGSDPRYRTLSPALPHPARDLDDADGLHGDGR